MWAIDVPHIPIQNDAIMRIWANHAKVGYNKDCSLKLDYMNKELLVIVNKNVTVDLAVWIRKSIQWDKLSNSGDTLVLQVPSTSREARYGWPNPSCVVISLKTFEKKVSNRGSKSEYILNHPTNNINIYSEKEQRVDGSYHVNNMWLRCTLRDLTPLMVCREKAKLHP